MTAIRFAIAVFGACSAYAQIAEPNVDRVFTFAHTDAMQDRQQIATIVRSMSEMRHVSNDTGLRTLTLRGTPAQASTAEWIFKKLDGVTEPQATAALNEYRPSSEDDVVRVFYLAQIQKPEDIQEVATVVRSVGEIRRLFTYTSQRALILRGTTIQMAMADWLFKELDKPADQHVRARQPQNSALSEFRPSNNDDFIRVFYLTHADSPQALQEIASQVRSISAARRMFIVNSQRAVAMRGTAAEVALADRLFNERDR